MAQHYKNESITLSRINVFTGWTGFNPKGNVAPGRMDQNLCNRLWTRRNRSAVRLQVADPIDMDGDAAPAAAVDDDDDDHDTTRRNGLAAAAGRALARPTRASLEARAFRPAALGDEFGPTFTTHLFRLDITVPPDLDGLPHLHLLWDSNCEALVLDADARPRQGLVGGDHWARRADYPLVFSNHSTPPGTSTTSENSADTTVPVARAGDTVRVYVEIACNGLFGAGRGGDIEPPDPLKFYKLEECCVAAFDPLAWALLHDVTVLAGMAKDMPETCPRRHRALLAANQIVNVVDVNDPTTYTAGRNVAATFLSNSPNASTVIHSMLHSHIDLAWLWPMAATPGKGARTFATQLRLLEQYPEAVFVQSQAQLYDWVKQRYPVLWDEICARVKEGRFVPVGATWVEMDCNLPSGESLVRQFIEGQGFFQENFGLRCKEFWLPDTFGYSAQLPQIMRGCGVENFLTQKLSWNLFNKFP
jgi:alpha-mannosidase